MHAAEVCTDHAYGAAALKVLWNDMEKNLINSNLWKTLSFQFSSGACQE